MQVERKVDQMSQRLDDHCDSNHQELKDIKDGISRIEDKLDKKADKDITEKLITSLDRKADRDDFLFWRNLLVVGILVNIFLLLLGIYLKR